MLREASSLALEGGLEPVEHVVEGLCELPQLVVRTGERDPRRQVVSGGAARCLGDGVDGSQRASGSDPAEDRGQHQGDDERDQRVGQQVREREVPLVLGSLQLEVRRALGQDPVVRSGAVLLGLASRYEGGRCLLARPTGLSRATSA